MKVGPISYEVSPITEYDIYLLKQGNHYRLYEKLGSHVMRASSAAGPDGKSKASKPSSKRSDAGTHFAVWAPNARSVSVTGDFNGWNTESHPLGIRWDGSGIYEGFIPGIGAGEIYKYHLVSSTGEEMEKADPFALRAEVPPRSASMVWDLAYEWQDNEWMARRKERNNLDSPWSIYEVHLGSWRKVPEDGGRSLSYRELALALSSYVKEMGFTHVELLPVMEHPFYGSWGYQSLGFFAPTGRYGTPQDFKYFVDVMHQQGIGVILDWVPSHFPGDGHGLCRFDGTHLFEHADPRKGFHPDWSSYIFNHGRNEVRSFLISSALFWLDQYHADGLRVDAVASMLYLDYSRKEGEWIPNEFGGNENLQAISFIRTMNEEVYRVYPDVQTIAEESTAWPMVSRPNYVGGLGFGMKWNMGWMHDTLYYMTKEPIHRKHHHNQLTFSMLYAFNENFVLSLSHDEVVHGKRSLLNKMPGDDWQKRANLRLLLGYLFAHPGKKLLFMGAELGQWNEWYHEQSLDWHLLDQPPHQGINLWVKDLNRLYRNKPALHKLDFEPAGFEWIDCGDWESSVVCFMRKGLDPKDTLVMACNFTPVVRHGYRVGVPLPGFWKELANSDSTLYGGSGQGNMGGLEARPIPHHGRSHSLELTLPPLAILFFGQEDPG